MAVFHEDSTWANDLWSEVQASFYEFHHNQSGWFSQLRGSDARSRFLEESGEVERGVIMMEFSAAR